MLFYSTPLQIEVIKTIEKYKAYMTKLAFYSNYESYVRKNSMSLELLNK